MTDSDSSASEVTFVIETDNGVLIHTLAPAQLLPGLDENGIEVEVATRNAVAVFGLPDFVFRSQVRDVGSGQREIGDAIVLGHDLVAVLQVKARSNPTTAEARERSWLDQQIAKASRQANGTVRWFENANSTLTNERGRNVTLERPQTTWLRVVVIDHPSPPDDYIPSAGPGVVVLLRRDWEFLFQQLLSTTAVLRYVRRISSKPPVVLGREPARYYQLALADLETPPEALDERLLKTGGTPISWPSLPLHPPPPSTMNDHLFLRVLMEDIARAPLAGHISEYERLMVLAALDTLQVQERANLGSAFREFMRETWKSGSDTPLWQHRQIIQPSGPRLYFSVANGADDRTREIYATYVQLRHQQSGETTESLDRLSVGVLLTPRSDGTRPWDTTLYATQGDQLFEPEFRALLEESWYVTMAK